MKIHHLRNATFILHLGPHKILVDPMLGEAGSLPGFRMLRGKRKANPLMELPSGSQEALDQVTCALLTHQHPDHLDKVACAWLREQGITLYVHPQDLKSLYRKSLSVKSFLENDLDMEVIPVPTKHGPGLVGRLMGKGTGWLVRYPGEPSIYITGDTVMIPSVSSIIKNASPEVVVAPAGAANFGIGPDILFPLSELLTLVELASGKVVFNHQEALDHCLLTRTDLSTALETRGLLHKCLIPKDGEELSFTSKL